jgi:two-component system sensor histidine kinase TctE
LVDFYDDSFRGDAVRVAVLLQPVASTRGQAMATVQVAETLELRHTLARQMLVDTLLRQMLLISVITAVVLVAVQRVTQPVRRLSESLREREEDDLTPIETSAIPREIQPLTDATNQVMQRLQHVLDHQKRFVRDAAHQLRTPLAVLKVQVQSALRGDVAARLALQEIQITVDRATALANQMLSLAKVEQVRQMQDFATIDWAEVVRAVALDVSPLIAEKDIDFELVTLPCHIHAHDWMLRELTRNLLHNAVRHTPASGQLSVRIQPVGDSAQLLVADTGSGISDDMRQRLFQPFATGDTKSGTGLGLTIAREIVQALDGSIQLNNRLDGGKIVGLDARILLPLNNSTK